METWSALLFTAYMIPVNLMDNALRPLVMGRGLATPTLIIFIGVIGGTISYGITGLFLGPDDQYRLSFSDPVRPVQVRSDHSGTAARSPCCPGGSSVLLFYPQQRFLSSGERGFARRTAFTFLLDAAEIAAKG